MSMSPFRVRAHDFPTHDFALSRLLAWDQSLPLLRTVARSVDKAAVRAVFEMLLPALPRRLSAVQSRVRVFFYASQHRDALSQHILLSCPVCLGSVSAVSANGGKELVAIHVTSSTTNSL